MMNQIRPPLRGIRTLLALVLLFGGCSARQENLALLPADAMYTRAVEAMEEREFDDAIQLLEFFVIQYIGDPRAPDARMMLGDANMEQREYPTAANHYQRLVNDFPLHPLALEARFRTCEAYYRLSPRVPLDQEYTVAAMLHCESVAAYYPGTTEAEQAQAFVDDMEHKLAEKTYNTAMHYFRQNAYPSAVVYLEDVIEQYPDTSFAPLALSQLVETYTRIGYVEDAEETRQRLLREYPQSPEAQALARMN
jgi:outer membrane assembly lipoprotein YfiO